jgi:hypothetical protein
MGSSAGKRFDADGANAVGAGLCDEVVKKGGGGGRGVGEEDVPLDGAAAPGAGGAVPVEHGEGALRLGLGLGFREPGEEGRQERIRRSRGEGPSELDRR